MAVTVDSARVKAFIELVLVALYQRKKPGLKKRNIKFYYINWILFMYSLTALHDVRSSRGMYIF